MLIKKNAGRFRLSSTKRSISLATVILGFLMPTTICAPPQGQPTLQITSPSGGTVVNPGQGLTVNVTSPTPSAFTGVDLYGDNPLGFVGTLDIRHDTVLTD